MVIDPLTSFSPLSGNMFVLLVDMSISRSLVFLFLPYAQGQVGQFDDQAGLLPPFVQVQGSV